MMVRINRAHFPVMTLGPGRRIGIWFQGCSLRCDGCVSRDTWDADATQEVSVASLLAWCKTITAGELHGVTISGGEPFEQAEALDALLCGIAQWRDEASLDFDLLCYSGNAATRLQREYSGILARLDALIPEPFRRAQHPGLKWRGSRNQPLLPLSDRGAERYKCYLDADADNAMQLVVEGGNVWMAGVPTAQNMQEFHKACAARGLKLEDVSWAP